MVTATFRFYGELNDFLAPPRRRREFERPCARAATTKHMVEALGVPHTEVELVLVNGDPAGLDRLLRDGDRVAVYPKFASLDVSPLLSVRDEAPQPARFVADAHLGGLARGLRMAGFDTLHERDIDDDGIARLAAAQARIVLSRDRELLKRRTIARGCYVRAQRTAGQLREVFDRFDLARSARPFTLCLHCNAPLRAVDQSQLAGRLPPVVRDSYRQFATCEACGRVFWQGAHWRYVTALVAELQAQPLRSGSTDSVGPGGPGAADGS